MDFYDLFTLANYNLICVKVEKRRLNLYFSCSVALTQQSMGNNPNKNKETQNKAKQNTLEKIPGWPKSGLVHTSLNTQAMS